MTKSAPLSNEEARDLLRSLGISEMPKKKRGRETSDGGEKAHDESITTLLRELSRSDIGRPSHGSFTKWP